MASTRRIGTRIRKIRLEKGMTLEDLGGLTNHDYSHLSKIERGERIPNIVLLQKIAAALSVSVEDFLK